MRRDGLVEMRRLGTAILWVAVMVSSSVSAQTREPGTTQLSTPIADHAGDAAAASFAERTTSSGLTATAVALGSGDLLEVSVFDTPELTQRVRVDSHGVINLPLVGELTVQGMTPGAVESTIRARLVEGHYVRDPQVSVFVAELAGQMAYVSGEVNRPGAYPLLRSHRLSDLIAVAGGMTQRAGNSATITHSASQSAMQQVDLNAVDEEAKNPVIEPGDSITIGQAGTVYVVGDVNRPGGFILDRRGKLSVIQAVALAEGLTPSAAVRKAQLIRTVNGERTEVAVDLKKVLRSESPDPQLQAGDILFVPSGLTRGLGRLSLQTVLATVSGMAIYSTYRY